MGISNQTQIETFILLGINGSKALNISLFGVFLLLYISTLIGNLLIIVLFLVSHHLNSPMYFFLSHLSLCDILLSTNVVPLLLCTLLQEGITMSTAGCITQFFAAGTFIGAECLILAIMSYDRYLAICRPLQYLNIMNFTLCASLVACSWFFTVLLSLCGISLFYQLNFCGCNVIDYIYCDFTPLLEASCSDTSSAERLTKSLATPVVLFPFLFIMLTYGIIFNTIFRISSTTGRQKAFSTCSSHLSVVCTFFGILIVKYVVTSRKQSINLNKNISLLYTAVTPLLNPIIYSLRNQVIRAAVSKWITLKTLR